MFRMMSESLPGKREVIFDDNLDFINMFQMLLSLFGSDE